MSNNKVDSELEDPHLTFDALCTPNNHVFMELDKDLMKCVKCETIKTKEKCIKT